MHSTKIDLPEATRVRAIEILAPRLADAIDVKLQAKQAHWNVKGPSFIALHELFDEVAGEADDWADELAERIAALGGFAEGTLQAVGRRTSLAPYSLTISEGAQHLAALSSALAHFGREIRASIDHATKLGDAGTADLFTQLSREVDKQLWFLEAHLQASR